MLTLNHTLRMCAAAALCALPTMGVYAQQRPNTVLERQIIESALHTIEDYEASATLSDDDAYYSLLDLFVSDEAMIYNDLLGTTTSKALPLKEYIKVQKSGLRNIIINFKDINRDDIWYGDDGKWHIVFRLNKLVSYSTECGVYLSSADYYGSPYTEKMQLVYNDAQKTCKIEKIEGSVDSRRAPLDKDYFVLIQNDKNRDKNVIITDQEGGVIPVSFNKHGQMLLPSKLDIQRAFSYPDTDVSTRVNVEPQCHTVTLDYKSRRWKLRPNIGIGLGDNYHLELSDDVFTAQSSGFEFGLDFGYTFPSQSRLKTSLNFGLGMATSAIKLDMQETDYNYHDRYYDIDGDDYIRHYQGVAGSQRLTASHLAVPVYIDFEGRISPYVSAYFNVGAKAYMKIHENNSDLAISKKNVYGVYPQYDNLKIDYRWGFNAFSREQTFDKATYAEASMSTFALDMMGGAGLRVRPVQSVPFLIDLGLSYQYSVVDFWSAAYYNLNTGSSNIDNAVLSYDGRGEQVRSLGDAVTSAKHQLLKLNIGLIYKF